MNRAPVEVQRSLLPQAELSDVVVVPVTPDRQQFDNFAPQTGWRGKLVRQLRNALRKAQRTANKAEAIHAMLF